MAMIKRGPADSAHVRNFMKVFDRMVADGVEALAGAGHLEDAKRLVARGLAVDGSPEMRALLEQRLDRAGKSFKF